MRKGMFKELVTSVKEAGKIRKGKARPSRVFIYSGPDVKRIRERMGVSQGDLASMIGVSRATLQNWEQGRRTPHGPARALLRIFEKNPRAVVKALAS